MHTREKFWCLNQFLSVLFLFVPSVTLAQGIESTPRGNLGDNVSNNQTGKKPNIVIIMADDVGTGDLPFFWDGLETSKVEMPNLQKLANKGIMFTDAHSSPLCAPSRYMLLSGCYPHRGAKPYGTWSIKAGSSQFTEHQKSIAETLRNQAGYQTIVIGKWHLVSYLFGLSHFATLSSFLNV